jgi:DnaK suppressor protein
MKEHGPSPNSTLAEEFRHRLRESQRELLGTLAVTDDEIATLERHQAGGSVEDAAMVTVASLLSRLEGREKHELDEIADAIQRLEAGAYGVCERCARAIALPRLRAIPVARYCIECQQRLEAQESLGGVG